jgi:hypothetical protein
MPTKSQYKLTNPFNEHSMYFLSESATAFQGGGGGEVLVFLGIVLSIVFCGSQMYASL